MGKYITRTITGKVVRSATMTINEGKAEVTENDEFLLTARNAEKEAIKRYGKGTVVTEVVNFSERRFITTDNFMKYSEPVELADVSIMEG